MKKYSISVLLIARNEDKTIGEVLKECINILPKLTKKYEILVNDDASTDKTSFILNSFAKKHSFIKVFYQKKPLGIAGGFEFLYKEQENDLAFTLAGDGQYTINDLPKMIKKIESGYDLVVGKRIHKQYNWKRNFISFCFNFVPKILFGVNLYDAGSIKLYKQEVLQKTTPLSKSVFNEAERIIKTYKLGYQVVSVPIQHFERKKGITSVEPQLVFDTIFDMLKLKLQYIFSESNLYFLPSLLIILFTLFPAFSLPFFNTSYDDLRLIKSNAYFGKYVSFFYPPLTLYLKSYGTHLASVAIAYKLFDFNSRMYFILNIALRILASFSIYYFVTKWSKSKLAGITSSMFFGVNTAGIDSTIRVTVFHTYTAIIFLMFFFDRWFKFHYHPTRRNLVISVVLFVLTIFSYPIRMVGIVFLVIFGEFYWLFKNIKNDSFRRLRIFHLLLLILSIAILIFLLGTISSTDEISTKKLSLEILLISLMTGNPPILTSLFLFVGNLLIPFHAFVYGYLSVKSMSMLAHFLPILGSIILVFCLIRRKFLAGFMIVPAILFPYSVFSSIPFLEDWRMEWVIITQFGGTLFLCMSLILYLGWDKDKHLGEIGFLGIGLILSNLLLPWMISPQSSLTDQSAFNLIHRYYTIPSIGMGMLLASLLRLLINRIKRLNQLKSLGFLLAIITIIAIILLQTLTTHQHLAKLGENINTAKIDLFWVKLKLYVPNIATKKESTLYLEGNGYLNEEYIKKYFPIRMAISLGEVETTPRVNFIFNEYAIKDTLVDENFYAFKFDGENLFYIKKQIK